MLVKLFEKIVRKNISALMEEHNKLNNNQHGSRQGRACLGELLVHYDHVLELLEEGMNGDVTYLDFSKAFEVLKIRLSL